MLSVLFVNLCRNLWSTIGLVLNRFYTMLQVLCLLDFASPPSPLLAFLWGCPITHWSTIGVCVFIGSNCIPWSSMKQHTIARSSIEVKYQAVTSLVAEIRWVTYVLRYIGVPLTLPLVLFTGNISALYLTSNPLLYDHTKYFELNYHFLCKKVVQSAMFTKFLSSLY